MTRAHSHPRPASEAHDEATYRAVFERVADAIIIHAKDGHRILDANPTCIKRLGYSLDELRQMTPFDLHPAEELDAVEARINLRNPEAPNSYVHVCKSGEQIPVEVLSDEIDYKGIPAWLSIARDIRERKAWEEIVAAARDEALAASRHKSQFVASISHELRTPMNGVMGMTSLLLESELNADQREFAETIQHAAGAMLDLLNELLDLAKIESGKLEIESIPFDLKHIVAGVHRILLPRARENGIDLIVDVDDRIPGRLLGDPQRIRQVVLNLAGNAIKFTQHGHVRIQLRELSRNGSDRVVGIEVSDSGIGIAPAHLAHIFEEFRQAEESTARRFGGTGLGLPISQRLVRLMGGELRVESEQGVGSRFSFELRLPVFASVLDPAQAQAVHLGTALVVHGEAMHREMLCAELGSLGLATLSAPTASKALSLLDEEASGEDLRLAVIDYVLPDLDGETFAQSLIRRGLIAPGEIVLERREAMRLDAARLKKRGIGALHGAQGDPSFAEILGVEPVELPVAPLQRPLAAPRPDEPRAVRAVAAAQRSESAQLAVGQQVLVVEDNKVNQRVIRHLLSKLGCRVDVAEHGREALQMVKRRGYDLIFMDCQMPEMDGYAATGAIRALGGAIGATPIVALTANAMDGDREKCLQAGMDDYLSKPASSQQIRTMLEKWAPAFSAN